MEEGRGYLVDSILQSLILGNQSFGILTILMTGLLNSLVPGAGRATTLHVLYITH